MPTPPREDVFSLGDDGLPSGVVTFLFTDVEGSTRLWDRHPDAMRAALERHDILLRAAIDAQGGHVFKATGDAFFAAFHRPQDALRAALDAQIALHAEPWSLPAGDGLRVRMALHTGAAQRRGGDYFGLPLSRAARLLAAAHGGQTLVSEAGAALLDGLMPGEASLHSLGRHRLKDLAQPQEVFALRAPGLADGFPPLRSLEAFAHNLPAQLTSFVGREAEMRDARARLGGTRLLTLTGTGGAGKTRLALQVAADALDGFPDGAWLTELAALADPALVTQAVAGVLGVREEADRPLRQSLADSLQSKRLLLLWDNCEHLVESCARLADWLLRACPGVIILATSRESLDIGGEAVLALSIAAPAGRAAAAAARRAAAVRLGAPVRRAGDRGPGVVPVQRGQRAGRGIGVFAAGRHPAGPGACRRAGARPDARADLGPAGRPLPAADGRLAHGPAAPADPAGADRLVV